MLCRLWLQKCYVVTLYQCSLGLPEQKPFQGRPRGQSLYLSVLSWTAFYSRPLAEICTIDFAAGAQVMQKGSQKLPPTLCTAALQPQLV